MHIHFEHMVNLYVHVMHTLTNMHIIFSGLPNIEIYTQRIKKKTTGLFQRKVEYKYIINVILYKLLYSKNKKTFMKFEVTNMRLFKENEIFIYQVFFVLLFFDLGKRFEHP